MIILTVNEQTVDCYQGDIVNDTINTSVGLVPFEWSTGFNVNQAISAISAYMDGNPVPVESTGMGWLIDLPSVTHPQAEITTIDFMTNLVNFKWINSAYTGDCAAELVFTVETTPAEVAGAITALL